MNSAGVGGSKQKKVSLFSKTNRTMYQREGRIRSEGNRGESIFALIKINTNSGGAHPGTKTVREAQFVL